MVLKKESKLFAEYNSLFSVVHDIDTSVIDISKDLELTSDHIFQWKMNFNLDLSKQTQETIFSRKGMMSSDSSVYYNSIPVSSTTVHKYHGMLFDNNLSYEHLKFVLNKVKKTIDLLCKFQQSFL